MKRLVVLLVLCLVFGLCACGSAAEPPAREAAVAEASVTVEFPAESPVPESDAAPEDATAETPSIEPVLEPAQGYSAWWGGKWYGWAVFTQARGRFLPQQDTSWDVVAQIDVDGSEGSIQIFDITSLDEPELTADVRFTQGLTEHGKMLCRYGSFIDIAYALPIPTPRTVTIPCWSTTSCALGACAGTTCGRRIPAICSMRT